MTDWNNLANAAVSSGNNSLAMFYSFMALQTDDSDWAIIRSAISAFGTLGPEFALMILEQYKSDKRGSNFNFCLSHFVLKVRGPDEALAHLKAHFYKCDGQRINPQYLISAVEVLCSKQEDELVNFFDKHAHLLISDPGSVSAVLRLLRSSACRDACIKALILAMKDVDHLNEEVQSKLLFLKITLNVISDNSFESKIRTALQRAPVTAEFEQFYMKHSVDSSKNECERVLSSGRFVDHNKVEAMIVEAILNGSGLSFVRMGDGEGRFVGDLSAYQSIQEKSKDVANRIWFWNSRGWPDERFFVELGAAYRSASIVGINPPLRIDLAARNDLLGYVGVVNGNQFVFENLQEHEACPYVTYNWTNVLLDKAGFFQRLVSLTREMGVKLNLISPYSDICGSVPWLAQPNFCNIVVPSDGSKYLRSLSRSQPHYPDTFCEVNEEIMKRNGEVFLVAAGVFAKIYCNKARLAGNVALDIGSLVDVWMNVPTRELIR